jgi:hypothetical protein
MIGEVARPLAAMEEPDLLLADLHAAFRLFRYRLPDDWTDP